MRNILVIGAYGLIGSNICKRLEKDYPNAQISKIKYDDIPPFEDTYDAVIYAAGYGQPIKFSKDKLETIGIHSGEPLLAALRSLKKTGKFLYVSSSEIYSGGPVPSWEHDIGNTTPQHPRACYIEGKRCGEAICMAFRELGYDVKIARVALAYGPGTKKGDTRVINHFIEQAITTERILMKDKGEATRTYCYIDDTVSLLLQILLDGSQPVYNVGGFSEFKIWQIADKIAKLTGAEVVPGADSLKGAPEEVKMSMHRTLMEFPHEFVNMDEGLQRTINYQKQLYGKA